MWRLPAQAKVSAPTRAGRALRRGLLKGCVVAIVVAGYSGKRFIYERAHELGIRRARIPCHATPRRPDCTALMCAWEPLQGQAS